MPGGKLKDPMVPNTRQRRKPQRGKSESLAGRVLTASSGVAGRSYARVRTVARRQTDAESREREAASLRTILWRVISPFVEIYHRFRQELKFFSFPAKAGLAASICSLLCFVPGPLSVLNKNGMWAVITADVCLETNFGLTVYKGMNRTFGTLAAAAVAVLVDFLASKCGKYEPHFVVLWAFIGGAIPTMFKFRPPFKDRWNYAVAMSMVTFHILILSQSQYEDKIKLPEIRMVTILIGFLVATLVNIAVAPKFAGTRISDLVAKNFERAGNVIERCVIAYSEGAVLEQVHDIRSGKSEDDNIHTAFHEIVAADAQVSKLLKAVPYEPGHGKFFRGYPWDIYAVITENLRYTLYDVVALDSCLRAEIQAPPHLRSMFEEDFQSIGRECAQVFRMIGQSIKKMKHVNCLLTIHKAEEFALILQHKLVKYMSTQLFTGTAAPEIAGSDPEAAKAREAYEESIRLSFQSAVDDQTFATPEGIPQATVERWENYNRSNSSGSADSKRTHLAAGNEAFLQRQESMGRHWNSTVQRISALSLIKFASILIELVAKAKYVAQIVEELEVKARFADA